MSKYFMFRKALILSVLFLFSLALTSCHRSRVQNPLAGLDSKQPDKVLFDRAMEAMKKGKYEVSRTVLQTLINTYPDSEYIARAKLAVGDSWYAEGGSSGLSQAEIEYKDFITFFPNVPEAAEAQLKVANIHYRQMEKPDRDFTHARRAEDEYRNLILQFPDSKLVPEAKQRLRQVQEVLGEREFRIGRFYYLRQSWPAAIARLKTLTDSYPLYSQADEALYMLGNSYESEIDVTRRAKGVNEVQKAKAIQEFTNRAAEAYSHLVSRYPVMERAQDAKKRLQAMGRPVPTPTAEAIAQNRAEMESRGETGKMGAIMGNFRRAPDMSQTAKVGEPNLTGTKDSSAPEFLRHVQDTMLGKTGGGKESGTVSLETVGKGAPPANQPVPRSDQGQGQGQQGQAQEQQGQTQEQQSQNQEQPQGKAAEQVQPQEQQPADSNIPELQPLPEQQPQQAPQQPTVPQSPPQTQSPGASSNDPSQPPKQVNDAVPQGESEQTSEPAAAEQQKSEDQGSATTLNKKNSSSSKKKKDKKPPPQS
jgi:outer membrane protein assembly factor BamD